MSKDYSFSAIINLNYSIENIFSILKNGKKIGLIYTDSENNRLSLSDSAKLIWTRYNERYQYGPVIEARHYPSGFSIWFRNDDNKIDLTIDPNYVARKKNYDISGWYGINFYHYQSLLLRLIGNNKIRHFETYEWFSQPYNPEDLEHDNKIYLKLYVYNAAEMYQHLTTNGVKLGLIWLDYTSKSIDIKNEQNILKNLIYNENSLNENANLFWYGIHNDNKLKFSIKKDRTLIIESTNSSSVKTKQECKEDCNQLDVIIRTAIELFKNIPVFRFITFNNEKDIINIEKMDE